MALLLAALGRPVSAQPGPPACVSCLVLELSASALKGLPPSALAGLMVLVRGGDPGASALAVRALADGGADAGLIVDPEGDAPGSYALRATITSLRATLPGVRIAVDADRLAQAGIALDAIAPYADVVMSSAGGARQWRRLASAPRPSADDLASASFAAGGERIVLPIEQIDVAAIAGFLARRLAESGISSARALTAGEVVARHQARRRREEAAVQTTIAQGTTTVLFEVPGMAAPVTITAGTTWFTMPGQADIEEQDIRINGASVAGGSASSPPRLPLLEPERVGVPPLALTLTDAYSYTSAGVVTLEGGPAYLIEFQPSSSTGAAGRAWIDVATFALRRLVTVQRNLRGAIVSSETDVEFERVRAGGLEVSLPARTRIFQVYEGAGFRTPIHQTLLVDRYDVNADDFQARLAAAHDSDHVMLRETPAGLRYLTRRSDEPRRADATGGQQVRAIVFGVLIDPAISRPLPLAGISYVNLNVLNRGGQLNAFVGGTYGQLSWSVPSIAGSAWQVHGSAFAIATRYNDRVFRHGVERYEENIQQRPAHAMVGVLRPLTPRVRLRADYALDLTGFARASTTAQRFRVPATAVTHGLVLGIDAERGAWNARAWWNPGRRQGWRDWGLGDAASGTNDFQRVGGQLSRTLALGPTVGARIEGSWVEGHDLDRFSRFSFNSFDNRLHGYPTASIRYDRGGVVRSVTTWSLRGLRIDGFADLGAVHDPGFDDRLRMSPGFGGAVETAGPFRTLWSAEWGYGARAIGRDGRVGTHTVQLNGYRTF